MKSSKTKARSFYKEFQKLLKKYKVESVQVTTNEQCEVRWQEDLTFLIIAGGSEGLVGSNKTFCEKYEIK